MTVGTTRKHRSDLVTMFLMFALITIGLIVIYAIGPMRANVLNTTYGSNYDSNYFFWHQLASVAVAIGAFVVTFKTPYQWIRKSAKWIFLGTLFLNVVLWIAALAGSSLAKCELGQCRWLNFGVASIQPAELLKFGLMVYLADFIQRKKEDGVIWTRQFWIPLLVVLIPCVLLVAIAQGDLGTTIVLALMVFAMLWEAGMPWKQVLIIVGIGIAGGLFLIFGASHRTERIDAWLTTLTGGESSDSTYHVDNAILAIGTGGLFGVGIGNSVQATGYLPESINDSVFAIMGETFGFIGLTVVVGLFAVMLIRLLKVVDTSPEENNRLIVIGVFTWIAVHVILNIGAMTALIPVTGITLPLLSYGGTSIAVITASLGLALQLSCYTSREVITNNENTSSGRGVRRTYYSSRRRSS